jgi:hypothetical protein
VGRVWPVVGVLLPLLGILSLLGKRWAYLSFVVLGLAWIPARTAFRLRAPDCETVVTLANSAFSLTNYKHIVMFGLFFLMTAAQFKRRSAATMLSAIAATTVMGLLIELEEGATGTGHCRLRDLVPDTAGAIVGLALLFTFLKSRAALASHSLAKKL